MISFGLKCSVYSTFGAMSEYLNVAGIISFDEFVHALDKGQLSQQLNAIQREYFHDQQFRNLILESVRVDQEQNGLRIVPSFRKCIKSCPTDECQLETEAASYVKTPPVPARSTSLHRRLKHSVEHIHRGTNVSEKIHQYHQQYIKKDCVLHYLKTKPSQKQYVQRSCGKQLVPQRQRKSKTDSKSDNEMSNRNVIKSLAGNVERKKVSCANFIFHKTIIYVGTASEYSPKI